MVRITEEDVLRELSSFGKNIYNNFVVSVKPKNDQQVVILFHYFLYHQLHTRDECTPFTRYTSTYISNRSQCQNILKLCSTDFLPNLFSHFPIFIRNIYDSGDEEFVLYILGKYFKHTSKKHKKISNLFLNSDYIQNYDLVKLILLNEDHQNLNKSSSVITRMKVFDYQIIKLLIENEFQLHLTPEMEQQFSKSELKNLQILCMENPKLKPFEQSKILKFLVENDYLQEIKEIINKYEIKLPDVQFTEESENLLFYCNSPQSLSFLIENQVPMDIINKNGQSIVHSLFRKKSLNREFVDQILGSFPIELLNKYDNNNKTPTNTLISNSNIELAKYVIEEHQLVYSEPEILNLPTELIEYICSHLLPSELAQISLSCKKFNRISNSDVIWHVQCGDRFQFNEETFRESYKKLYQSFVNSCNILRENTDFNYGPFFQKSFCNNEWREYKIDEIIQKLIVDEFKQKTINLNHKFIKESPELERKYEDEYFDELMSSIKNFRKNKNSAFKRIEKYWRDNMKKCTFIEYTEKEFLGSCPLRILELIRKTILHGADENYKVRYFRSQISKYFNYLLVISDDVAQLYIL